MSLAFEQNIMPWELETFATFSIIYDDESVEMEIDSDSFSRIITLIRNYRHPELMVAETKGVFADTFLMISSQHQFPVQGVFLQKLFRYNYIFDFANSCVNMKEEFCKMFISPYINFVVFAFIVFVYSSKDAYIKGQEDSRQSFLEKAFKIDHVFEVLCISKEKYKEELKALYKNNVLDYYYGLKIQYVYPFVSAVDFTYFPSPYLVINAVTESLLNRLTHGNSKLRSEFGKEVIERYLFDIYKEVPGVTWMSSEFVYNVGKDEKKTPDVLAAEGNYCIFFDTKALSPSLKIRQFDQEEINKEVEIYAKNILQVYQQIIYYSEGYFNLDKPYEKKNLFGVVVVFEDAVVSRERVYERAFEMWVDKVNCITENERKFIHSHVKVVSLSQIEHMVLQNMSFLSCLLQQEDNADQWNNIIFENPNRKHGLLPIYQKYDLKVKDMVTQYLNKTKEVFHE